MKKQSREEEDKPEAEIWDKDLKKISEDTNDFNINEG